MNSTTSKRKSDDDVGGEDRRKLVKTNSGAAKQPQTQKVAPAERSQKGKGKEVDRGQVTLTPSTLPAADASITQSSTEPQPDTQPNPNPPVLPRRQRIRKLAPPRPFPTVSLASSATGPRSAHHEGKNHICITRKTKLAAYLRRCKALLIDDGFKELRLSAMGAAIPHLALLAVSLPPILPWAEDEVKVEVFTGSADVHDEILSESEEEGEGGPEEEFRTRTKSTMNVIIRIGDGEQAPTARNTGQGQASRPNKKKTKPKGKGGEKEGGPKAPEPIMLQEPEQDDMDDS
ncbi:hypothetical protein HYDPIDRAFT_113254 [Hydnomerulius pinastri MD-312]|uniref:Uncharacterized protein n=1 Tax=Hydnomerulius pinastri MD-312 TaxID=994086 RepID=A0A0C9W7Q1_9AGAM|nr:hypothetical protein HYDPIDRAFT_113254 [Hydnomerulius pinastri MD-312]